MKISAAQSLTCSVYASDATLALLSLPVAHATGTTLRAPGRAALPATRRNLASLKCWSKFKTNMLQNSFQSVSRPVFLSLCQTLRNIFCLVENRYLQICTVVRIFPGCERNKKGTHRHSRWFFICACKALLPAAP